MVLLQSDHVFALFFRSQHPVCHAYPTAKGRPRHELL